MSSRRGIDRRSVVTWGGLAAAGLAAAPASAASAAPAARPEHVPPATRPGGAYDRYVARLAAEGTFSGVVLLSHHGRTVLSRAYGMADRERGVAHHENIAFALSSAGKPFKAVALLQLVQAGRLKLSDTVGTHLTGYPAEIADRVTVHHLLAGLSGLNTPALDPQRIFHSREEVHGYWAAWGRRAQVVAPPGTPGNHTGADTQLLAQLVEAVSGRTYWDHVEEHVFRRAGMTGSAFFTRPQWLADERLAHPYMALADGSRLDAIRHLDVGSPNPYTPDQNPGRAFIDAPGDGGFATAPDLARFGRALCDGTLLDRRWAEVLLAPNLPLSPVSFSSYGCPVRIVGDQWVAGRGGGAPGIGANWTVYPNSGWVGVILGNTDGFPLVDMIMQEIEAVTGVPSGGGGGG